MTTKQERVSDDLIAQIVYEKESRVLTYQTYSNMEERHYLMAKELQQLRAVLPKVRDALELASKRSSYPWSEGPQYTSYDCKSEGRIELALELLAILDSLEVKK